MRIGIDIDNTLTEVKDELNNAARDYAIKLGKNFIDDKKDIEETKNNGEEYKKKYNFTYEELKYFLKDIQEEIINNAKPRKDVVKVIKKLKEKGHQIYIVTARDSEFHDDPYMLSKNWLDKNNITYDKLIVNARNKVPVCLEEKIDLFIDDQLNNCINISNQGIEVIRINDDHKLYDNFVTFNNWEQIYNYIIHKRITLISYFNDDDINKINELVKNVDLKMCKVPYGINDNKRYEIDNLPFHLTIFATDKENEQAMLKLANKIDIKNINIEISNVDIMKGRNGSYVLYFSLKENLELKKIQQIFFEKYPKEKYNPKDFIFHITIHIDKDYSKILKIKEIIERDFKTNLLTINKLALYNYPGDLIKIIEL